MILKTLKLKRFYELWLDHTVFAAIENISEIAYIWKQMTSLK